jgi:hypothetical protein
MRVLSPGLNEVKSGRASRAAPSVPDFAVLNRGYGYDSVPFRIDHINAAQRTSQNRDFIANMAEFRRLVDAGVGI